MTIPVRTSSGRDSQSPPAERRARLSFDRRGEVTRRSDLGEVPQCPMFDVFHPPEDVIRFFFLFFFCSFVNESWPGQGVGSVQKVDNKLSLL